MRKLGLILVLLFTLSIVSATDFTLSGKIDAKSGASIIDQNYNVKYTFSDGTVYGGDGVLKVAVTNGVFTTDFSGLPNAANVIANSNSVDMEITGLADTSGNVGVQTFSNIPLTTVPKAVYATKARNPLTDWVIKHNAGALKLIGTDHTYMAFYPDGESAGRKGYFGFPGPAIDNIMLKNEISGAGITLDASKISLKGPINSGGVGTVIVEDALRAEANIDVRGNILNAAGGGSVVINDKLAVLHDALLKKKLTVEGATTLDALTAGATSISSLTMSDISGASRFFSPVGVTIFADKDNNGADTESAFRVVANAASFNSPVKYLLNLNQNGDLAISGTFEAGGDATITGDLIAPNIRSGLTGAKVIIKDNRGLEVQNNLEVGGTLKLGQRVYTSAMDWDSDSGYDDVDLGQHDICFLTSVTPDGTDGEDDGCHLLFTKNSDYVGADIYETTWNNPPGAAQTVDMEQHDVAVAGTSPYTWTTTMKPYWRLKVNEARCAASCIDFS